MKNLSKKLLIPLSFGLLAASCSPGQTAEHMDDGHSHDGSTQQMSVNTSQENRNIESVLSSYSGLINSKDVAAMEAFVLPNGTDFTIFEGKGTNIGWADYRDHHLAPEFANEDLVFTKYDYKDYKTNVSGDLATASFSIDMAYTYKGEDKTFTRHGTAILKKVNGAWKIAHLHTS
ncbi:MAG: hypothetical protein COB36_13380 [Alphaproteobacteria bacterium]|nr:MAG: hypothetical protein COB36_13380 [Alphaproteobacteria bacterium]